ncbi:MAG: hypothetical protein HQ568_01625 [Calditrichaeota bacterium]|nr:hypothetical protein [Calditrichota bacterium]
MKMFENFNSQQKRYMYLGLKSLIEPGENYGRGIHDGGHPVYRAGAHGDKTEDNPADSPDKNELYKMLEELSTYFKGTDITGDKYWVDLSDWQMFCKYVLYNYYRNKGITNRNEIYKLMGLTADDFN